MRDSVRLESNLLPVLRHRVLLLIAVACLTIGSDALFTQDSPARPNRKPQKTIAALIDFDRTAVGALLETELLNEKGLAWVERTEIDRILGEQKLQLLFSPEGVKERATISRLLKADVLVLLRSGMKEDKATAEIAVAEVSRGVRLVSRTVLLSSDTDADVQTLLSIARQGIAKQRNTIEAIYAVPPFLSKDLLFDHHDLRKTYARFIEQQLLEQPQVLVVEFAEAEALMRERAIDANDEKIRRLLPHYLLGEYRNEGKDGARNVTITLTHKQGEQELARVKQTIKPEQSASFLRETVDHIVEQQTGKPPATPDLKREAAQLLARAKEYLTLGDFEDAAALAEASLLLDSEQIEPHVVAIRALTPLMTADPFYWNNDLDKAEASIAPYFRAVDHLIEFYREGGQLFDHMETGGRNFMDPILYGGLRLKTHIKLEPEIEHFLAEVLPRHRQKMMVLYNFNINTYPGHSCFLLNSAMIGSSVDEVRKARFDSILRHQNLPNAAQIVESFSTAGFSLHILDTSEGKQFLEDLEVQGNDTVKNTVAALRIKRDEFMAMHKKEDEEAAKRQDLHPIPNGAPRLSFEPFKLTRTLANGNVEDIDNISYWLAVDQNLDILVAGASIYLMREPGVLETIWEKGSPCVTRFDGVRRSGICYDGRYIWIAVSEHRADDHLVVLDPESGEWHELTEVQGLPNPAAGEQEIERSAQLLSLAPIGPGKIIVAGGFGRSWVGEATFDEKTGGKIDIFHEAPEMADPANHDQWRSTKVEFPISLTATLYDDEIAKVRECKVLVLRSGDGQASSHLDVGYHPLVIDASSKEVHAFEQKLHNGENIAIHNGALYQVHFVPPDLEQLAILRIGLPGPSIEMVLPLKESGYLIADGNRFHVVGKQWWIADMETQTVVPTGTVPWIYNSPYVYTPPEQFEKFDGDKKQLVLLTRSHFYGLVAVYRDTENKSTLSQVTFTNPTPP